MHVDSRKTAVGGMAVALAVLCIVLSGILEFNTLFLLAAASFFPGIVIRESGLAAGTASYVAAAVLGFLLAPNKLYCITFAAMGFYVVCSEGLYLAVARARGGRHIWLWLGKFAIFNLLYLPALTAFPRLIFADGVRGIWLLAAAATGQVLFLVYDRAYEYFLTVLWEKFRTRLNLK